MYFLATTRSIGRCASIFSPAFPTSSCLRICWLKRFFYVCASWLHNIVYKVMVMIVMYGEKENMLILPWMQCSNCSMNLLCRTSVQPKEELNKVQVKRFLLFKNWNFDFSGPLWQWIALFSIINEHNCESSSSFVLCSTALFFAVGADWLFFRTKNVFQLIQLIRSLYLI